MLPFKSNSSKKQSEQIGQSKSQARIIIQTEKQITHSNTSQSLHKTYLIPSLNEFQTNSPTIQKEGLKFDKFICKSKKLPNFDTTLKNPSSPEIKQKISGFRPSPTKCPFSNEMLKTRTKSKEISLLNKEKISSLSEFLSQPKFTTIILDFEQKILKIPQLFKYFQKVDINTIFQGKLAFFRGMFEYKGKEVNQNLNLESIHRKLAISNDDFNVFKGFFSIVMREHLVEEVLIADFLNLLENYRKNIVLEPTLFQIAFSDIKDFEKELIDLFRDNVINNPILNQFFFKKDISFQINHCKAVILYLLKEDNLVETKNKMKEVHQNCIISDDVFYHFKQSFLQSLKHFQKKPENKSFFLSKDLYEISDRLENLRSSVLNQKTYYEILVKNNELELLIDIFTSITLKKPILEVLFQGKENKVRIHAKLMLEFLLGGPTKYNKFDITPAHYNLSISTHQFEAVREALEEALTKLSLLENDRTYILSELDYFKYNLCNQEPLLKRLGGEKVIDELISSFYLKAYQHPKLKGYFKDSDILSMITNQRFWFCRFFDLPGMKSYHFKDLRSFHLGMGITKEAFEFFVETFMEGLKENNLNDEEIRKEAVIWLERVKNDVLDNN